MSTRDAAWLAEALPERRIGVKGPRAAEALKQLGLAVPARPNTWTPLRAQDRDDSWNIVGRLGSTEFFIEERGEAQGIEALEQLTRGDFAGAQERDDSTSTAGAVAAKRPRLCPSPFNPTAAPSRSFRTPMRARPH